jgi:hypothetical protein
MHLNILKKLIICQNKSFVVFSRFSTLQNPIVQVVGTQVSQKSKCFVRAVE